MPNDAAISHMIFYLSLGFWYNSQTHCGYFPEVALGSIWVVLFSKKDEAMRLRIFIKGIFKFLKIPCKVFNDYFCR